MAGMLAGVECARRRRLHQGGGWTESQGKAGNGRTRRSSFCLYTSNHDTHLSSSSSQKQHQQRKNQSFNDEDLGGVAREAKERLDERLRAQRKPETKRHGSKERVSYENISRGSSSITQKDLQTEVFGLKKNSSRRFSWAKLGWKASEQDECTVCLEHFKAGDALVYLPCVHRFHSRCLVPWLDNSAHCPCCRMGILT